MSGLITQTEVLCLRGLVKNEICASKGCTGLPAKGEKLCAECKPKQKNVSLILFRRR